MFISNEDLAGSLNRSSVLRLFHCANICILLYVESTQPVVSGTDDLTDHMNNHPKCGMHVHTSNILRVNAPFYPIAYVLLVNDTGF